MFFRNVRLANESPFLRSDLPEVTAPLQYVASQMTRAFLLCAFPSAFDPDDNRHQFSPERGAIRIYILLIAPSGEIHLYLEIFSGS